MKLHFQGFKSHISLKNNGWDPKGNQKLDQIRYVGSG